MKRLLILDSNSIINRAFYGIRYLSAKDGTPTNAVYGFMNPVCGVTLSAIFLQESSQAFGLTGIISLLLVCAGIFMVNKSE